MMLSMNQTSAVAMCVAISQAVRDFASGLYSRLPLPTAPSTWQVPRASPSHTVIIMSAAAFACSGFIRPPRRVRPPSPPARQAARALTSQLPVLDAMRPVGLGAEAPLPVGFVVLVVAFEPHDAAV